MMGNKHANDITVQATVIDEDTIRYGGSAFVRERTCKMHFNQIAGMMQCSECGEYTLLGVWQKDQGHLNWCANCGARVERDAS